MNAIDLAPLTAPNTPMPRTVLVVDDAPHIRALLVFAFEKAGMAVREAADGEEALADIARAAPDLVVLDINMPRMDGLEVCRRLRATSEVPVLFLSSRDEEFDRVLGIELGADDYVVKPFSPRAATPAPAATLTHGLLTLDAEGWTAHWAGTEVPLTVSEFNLLKALASAVSGSQGRILSRDQLIDQIHGPGFAITDRTIDSHIRNLRRKFAEGGGHDVVETKAGVGYRLGACLGGASTKSGD